MIPVVTVAQMRLLDEAAIGKNKTTGYSYMLKAGTGLFEAARNTIVDHRNGDIAVVCGKGNNGGDGYVAARLLLEAGFRVMCFSLCPADALKGEARIAFNEYVGRKGNFQVLDDAGDLDNLSRYRFIIDAMLGTGVQGNPHGLCAAAIEAINESRIPVIAADTPSGLDNDTGIPGAPCIKATVTGSMGFPKVGLYFYPGRTYAGRIEVVDLGYPDDLLSEHASALFLPTIEDFQGFLPARKPAGSKFDHGLALLLSGSRGLTGSATLVARAALRIGCGMIHLAAPASIIPTLSGKLTETVLHPIPETEAGSPSPAALAMLKEWAASMHAFAIGPGLSHDDATGALVRDLVSSVTIPLVLDADGINAYRGRASDLASHAGDLIITPHAGEWQRLFGTMPEAPIARIDRLKETAVKYRMVVLLKGNPTLVADPQGTAYVLPFGNSSLAKAGSGDVLSGIIVSLLAQGAPATPAALLGVYILGETGTILSRKFGEYSVIASDIVNSIYLAIRTLQREEG